MRSPTFWLGAGGFLITTIGLARNVKGSMIYGIVVVTLVSWFRNTSVTMFPNTPLGDANYDYFKRVFDFHTIKSTAGIISFKDFNRSEVWVALITLALRRRARHHRSHVFHGGALAGSPTTTEGLKVSTERSWWTPARPSYPDDLHDLTWESDLSRRQNYLVGMADKEQKELILLSFCLEAVILDVFRSMSHNGEWEYEDGDPCTPVNWEWVKCSNSTPPRITKIALSGKDLNGTIPSEIKQLDQLTELYAML
ncbi:hypothetical protein J5N97_012781 [Dioscorea zingiberensis]|uniref:Uncharacterized protein n=1 Tax=Dioscorea zingiberensis TaxID=325984 RepID=A0A9D5CRP9_9LILI|nr:hypothetical protein J5N97_012781 [Dioscorea zingiberensis]